MENISDQISLFHKVLFQLGPELPTAQILKFADISSGPTRDSDSVFFLYPQINSNLERVLMTFSAQPVSLHSLRVLPRILYIYKSGSSYIFILLMLYVSLAISQALSMVGTVLFRHRFEKHIYSCHTSLNMDLPRLRPLPSFDFLCQWHIGANVFIT